MQEKPYISRPGILSTGRLKMIDRTVSKSVFIVAFKYGMCVYDSQGNLLQNLTKDSAKFYENDKILGYSVLAIEDSNEVRYFHPDAEFNPVVKKYMKLRGSSQQQKIQIIHSTQVSTLLSYANDVSVNPDFQAPQTLQVPDYKGATKKYALEIARWAVLFTISGVVLVFFIPLIGYSLLAVGLIFTLMTIDKAVRLR